jgi:hypothetical protein
MVTWSSLVCNIKNKDSNIYILRMDEMVKKIHEREKFTVTVATYATAAAQNVGPGGTVKFINSAEPMAVEQERLKERRLNIIVRGVEEHPNPEEAGFIKKAYDIEQAAIIANIKVPGFSINESMEAMQQCFRLGKDNTHTKRPIKVAFKTGHEEVRDGLIGGKPDANASQQGADYPVQNSGRSYNESTEVV